MSNLFSYIMKRTRYIQWNDYDVWFVLDKHAKLDFEYNAKLLKQQSVGRHISPLVILILIHVNSSAREWYAVPASHKTPACCSYIKGHNGLPAHTSLNKLVLNCSQQKQYDNLVINITGNNYKCTHARTDGYDSCNIWNSAKDQSRGNPTI